MAYVPIPVDANGDAPDPGIGWGDTVQWILDPGVTGPFSLKPPRSIFENDDNPKCFTLTSNAPESPIYTVKFHAQLGHHWYAIDAGPCKRRAILTGPQRITVRALVRAKARKRSNPQSSKSK